MQIGLRAKMIGEALVLVLSAIFSGGCLLHSSSRTQKIVSLSSAESEMYAAASGACDSVLIVGVLKWMFDAFFQIHLYLDSGAARGIINRRGVGKVRHLSCRSLWLQERMEDGSLVVSPVSGTTNPADIGTKRLNVNRMKALMCLLGMFDSVNSCHVGETEAHSIIHHQEIRKAMQSVRRRVKCEDSPLQILVLMSALGLAWSRQCRSVYKFCCWQLVDDSNLCCVCICSWWYFHLGCEEIHDRRAENLAILDERYEHAYINGDQEEMWAIEAQMDWWTNVL